MNFDGLVDLFTNKSHIIVGVILAIVVYSMLQAVIKVLSGYFQSKLSWKFLGSNGKDKADDTATIDKLDELIKVNKEIGAGTDKRLSGIEGKVGDMHTLITDTDKDGIPKMKVLHKKVREMWNQIIRGGADA